MIRYALKCVGDHGFEAWFSDSESYVKQRKRGLIECPRCGSKKIEKQIMAPAVSGTKNKSKEAVSADAMFAKVAGDVRKHIEDTHEFVGERFADEARSMHAGEQEARPVWGEVTSKVATELREEGVPALPLPKPFAPEPPKKPKKLN